MVILDRAQEVQARRRDRNLFLASSVDCLAVESKFKFSMHALICRIVGLPVDPVQLRRAQKEHVVRPNDLI